MGRTTGGGRRPHLIQYLHQIISEGAEEYSKIGQQIKRTQTCFHDLRSNKKKEYDIAPPKHCFRHRTRSEKH